MKLKQILLIVAISAVSAITSVWIYGKVNPKQSSFSQSINGTNIPANYAGFFDGSNGAGEPVDFTKAANSSVPAVVHIKTKIPARKVSNGLPRNRSNGGMEDLFEQFFNRSFGPQIQPEQRASGSGVIISDDGYIITNNHVVSDGGDGVATEITVTLHNKKEYKAKVIGRDPSSDLAVLKVDGKGLPFLLYGNSDNVKLGQWVLAIGYPLTLETTVTAGIVSAKGRNIGINSRQSNTPIESFIQTDAAVNQGNSGGALITTDGQLVGINSAIYAPTGTYAGYSFAIPVNLVKKIVNDLIKFGDVKRGYIGISYSSLESENERLVKQESPDLQGVYVLEVPSDGAAAKVGIKKGDIIISVNNIPVTSGAEMSAKIATFKPNDKVPLKFVREKKEFSIIITLNESPGKIGVNSRNSLNETLGAELETINEETALKNNIDGGVIIKKIKPGGIISKTKNLEQGFIITTINGMEISSKEELSEAINALKGESIQLEGVYEDYDGVYRYPLYLKK